MALQPPATLPLGRSARGADLESLRQRCALEELPLSDGYFTDRSQDIGMVEVIVPADSDLVGKTVVEAEIRSRFGLTVIGLRHGRVPREDDIVHEKLRIGDTLLVVGSWKDMRRLHPGRKALA